MHLCGGTHLLVLADSYNIHGISGLQVLPCIIYVSDFITISLV